MGNLGPQDQLDMNRLLYNQDEIQGNRSKYELIVNKQRDRGLCVEDKFKGSALAPFGLHLYVSFVSTHDLFREAKTNP